MGVGAGVVVGGENVQRQHLGGLDGGAALLHDDGLAVGQGQVLVEQLEAVGQGEEHADGDGGHHVGDGDLEQGLGLGGAVDAGGLQHVLGHRLEPGDVDNHHVADLLPAHEDDEAPEAVFGVHDDGGGELAEDAVEDHGPDVAQHNAADEVGHEEHGAEDVAALDVLGEDIGHGKGQHVDEHQGYHGEQGGVPEGVGKGGVLERPDVVAKADGLGVGNQLELAEGEVNALDEGPDKADDERAHHRAQEQREPFPGGPADGVAAGDLFPIQGISSLSQDGGRMGL